MWHVAACAGNVSTTANTAIAAVVDDVLSRNSTSNNLMLPNEMDLIGAAAMSATLNRVRLNMPSFRMVAIPFIRPIFVGAVPPAQGRMALYLDDPIRLPAWEELAVEATSDIAMGNEICNVVLFLSMGLTPVPPGKIYTVRATSTTAAVANTWTTISYTLSDTLPPGTYSIVSTEHISTTGVAHRLIIPNQVPRPGFLSFASLGLAATMQQLNRDFGEMGRFINTNLPSVQVLCNSTDNAHTLYMQLKKVA